jgi:hypothetical protein
MHSGSEECDGVGEEKTGNPVRVGPSVVVNVRLPACGRRRCECLASKVATRRSQRPLASGLKDPQRCRYFRTSRDQRIAVEWKRVRMRTSCGRSLSAVR